MEPLSVRTTAECHPFDRTPGKAFYLVNDVFHLGGHDPYIFM
jgi:hypothetical protein